MRVDIDRALCSGHALCNAVGGSVYDIDEEGLAAPLMDVVPPELQREARGGAAACPEQAITLST